MRKSLIAAVLVVIVATAAYAMRPDARAERAAKTAILSALRDPDGATFGPWHHVREGDMAGTVCGSVNARNGFGGMAGFRAVLVSPAGAVLFPEDGPRDERTMELLTRCE